MSARISKFDVIKGYFGSLFKEQYKCGDLYIIGDEDFIEDTVSSIKLLKDNHNESYRLVNKHIDNIIFKKDYTHINTRVKICFVGREVSAGSSELYASLLALYAYFFHQYKIVKSANPNLNKIPRELWCEGKGRKAALKYQKTVLSKLGANEDQITKIDSQINQLKK
jgi:hypothetical protein